MFINIFVHVLFMITTIYDYHYYLLQLMIKVKKIYLWFFTSENKTTNTVFLFKNCSDLHTGKTLSVMIQ